MATKDKDLNDLFIDTLKDIYFAEKQILKALPKMAKAATSSVRVRRWKTTHRPQSKVQRQATASSTLAPLLRGEGWGEGLLRSAYCVVEMSTLPCPSPAAKTRRPLPPQSGERLSKRHRCKLVYAAAARLTADFASTDSDSSVFFS